MCGIVGFLGSRDVKNILLRGLQQLEYRGYESAGLVILDDGGRPSIHKAAEGVESLRALRNALSGVDIPGKIGIAHTRWPTHGGATVENAHPHSSQDGKIWLVHNGVLENFEALRREVIESGFELKSETDTELVAHLIETELKSHPYETAVKNALARLEGAFALAILSTDHPDTLILACRTSPLLIGEIHDSGASEFIVASDNVAIIEHTRTVFELHDDEMAVITPAGCKFTTIQGVGIPKGQIQIETASDVIDKGPYEHHMRKEIHQQPDVVIDTTRGRLIWEEGTVKLGGLARSHEIVKRLSRIDRVTIVACGTAYYAGLVGTYLFHRIGLAADVHLASEFQYGNVIFDPDRTMVIAVSQSGETIDTIRAVEEAKRRGALTVGIVNRVGSRLTRVDDCGIYTRAGFEIGVASTKAFVAQLTVLAMMMVYFGREHLGMSKLEGQALVKELQMIPDKIRRVLALEAEVSETARMLSQYRGALFLGRGVSYPVALEGALKLKEVSYIHAEGYAAGEMKHGPIALLDSEMPVVVVAPVDSVYEKTASNVQEVKARNAPLVVVTTKGCDDFDRYAQKVIKVPETIDMLSPLLTVVPLQMLAYHAALHRGANPDRPRNLAKSVTVE